MVSGALALVWGQHPTWTYQQVINQVLSTVQPLASLQGKVKTGGLLNVAAAVGWTSAAGSSFQVVSVVNPNAAANTLSTVQITFSQAVNPATLTPSAFTLTGPMGSLTPTQVQVVSGSGNKQVTLTFATQNAAGTYTLQVSSAVRNTINNSVISPPSPFTLKLADLTPPAISAVSGVSSGTTLIGLIVTFTKAINPGTLKATGIAITTSTGRSVGVMTILPSTTAGNTQFLIQIVPQVGYGTFSLKLSAGISDTLGNVAGVLTASYAFARSQTASVELLADFAAAAGVGSAPAPQGLSASGPAAFPFVQVILVRTTPEVTPALTSNPVTPPGTVPAGDWLFGSPAAQPGLMQTILFGEERHGTSFDPDSTSGEDLGSGWGE
jgi:hypothetical protein